MDYHLSIVVTGRNDDYGGDFNTRLQNSVSWWSYFLRLNRIKTEYLFVNWNALPGKPCLSATINWHSNEYFDVKFIEVPPEVHKDFDQPQVRKPNQLYEFLAKNAGIRRAQGQYILSTNADILCDPEIFKVLAEQLKENTVYRADRYDYHTVPAAGLQPLEQLEKMRQNVFSIKGFGGDFPFNYTGNIYSDVKAFKKANARFLKWHLFKFRYEWFFRHLGIFGISINYDNAEYRVHTVAAGDFTLMHRNNWHQLKGYAEDFYMTMHNDSELLFNAYAAGLAFKVLFYPVYHQNHERRYTDADPAIQQAAYKVYKEVQKKAQRLLKTMRPEITNTGDWGLRNYNLAIKTL